MRIPTAGEPQHRFPLRGPNGGMYVVGLIVAVFWAGGTNFLTPWLYPIHGISLGDLLFAAWLVAALAFPAERQALGAAFYRVREHAALLVAFGALLLLSSVVNSYRFGLGWDDVMSVLRFFYFVALMTFTVAFTWRFGSSPLLIAFLAGIAMLGVGRLLGAMGAENQVYAAGGFLLISDTNVIGNMLGVGALLCSMAILSGVVTLPLAFFVLFAALSTLTFSKGTWLTVAVAGVANAAALMGVHRLLGAAVKRRFAVVSLLMTGVFVGLVAAYWDALTALIRFKLVASTVAGSVDARWRFAVAGLKAMLDNPLFGLGLSNFQETYKLYWGLQPAVAANAHNLFLQIAAVGGLPAFAMLLVLIFYPFPRLYRGVALSPPLRLIYVMAALGVFIISASVQLQLMAQPFFWFFSAIAIAWATPVEAEKVGVKMVGPVGPTP